MTEAAQDTTPQDTADTETPTPATTTPPDCAGCADCREAGHCAMGLYSFD
ncbi:hypothetical protein P1J78_17895 [Psychromarinibacter sp. C21-152]|uniref:Uncharacterized protein n=1 Tax=Psychromarinibacter sediminicola TaxID=3033385 RepID=A0AAE3T9H8_9RHOB|nr:hypothetical protein [Psychromarinibacter sediminicola]MDF0602615.1 hypothetical protein [Psychromarinibacter sediminicola]